LNSFSIDVGIDYRWRKIQQFKQNLRMRRFGIKIAIKLKKALKAFRAIKRIKRKGQNG